jgi:hypothetical protein
LDGKPVLPPRGNMNDADNCNPNCKQTEDDLDHVSQNVKAVH